MLWVLLYVGIALAGLVVLGLLALRVWRSVRALLGEVGVVGRLAGDLAGLLAQVQIAPSSANPGAVSVPKHSDDPAWPGTVETYDDVGAAPAGEDVPRKKD